MKRYSNYDISTISYIHVGGIVQEYIEVEKLDELMNLIKINSNIRPIGNTSKILFAFDKTEKRFVKFLKNAVYLKDNNLFAYSGISLKKLGQFCFNNNITGFEYLSSIPGLLGGSIAMNASFFNQSISENIVYIYVVDNNGKLKKINKSNCQFEYRNSLFKFGDNGIIIGALFKIKKGEKNKIKDRINQGIMYREKTQPKKFMTLGSTFINPKDVKIGKIIDEYKLKGKGNDEVKISQKHGNFLIIKPHAKYQNILSLIETISLILYNKIGYLVETEIIIIR